MTLSVTRVALEKDIPFIYDAWMKTMKGAFPFKAMPSQTFNKEFKSYIKKTIDKSEVFVLCNKDDQEQLYSFVVGSRLGNIPIIHFAYTKSIFWKMGLMRKLIEETFPEVLEHGCVYTNFSPALHSPNWFVEDKPFSHFLEMKYGMLFNPFMEGA